MSCCTRLPAARPAACDQRLSPRGAAQQCRAANQGSAVAKCSTVANGGREDVPANVAEGFDGVVAAHVRKGLGFNRRQLDMLLHVNGALPPSLQITNQTANHHCNIQYYEPFMTMEYPVMNGISNGQFANSLTAWRSPPSLSVGTPASSNHTFLISSRIVRLGRSTVWILKK